MNLRPNVNFENGEVIFKEGKPAFSVFLICDGAVKVYKQRGEENVLLSTLGKDSIFGEMAFISNDVRCATVISDADTWCYALTKEDFMKKMEALDPVILKIFHDLSAVIKEKNDAGMIIDHGKVHSICAKGKLTTFSAKESLNNYAKEYSFNYLTKDPHIRTKVDDLDFFMRKLYNSMVNIACA